MNKKDKQYCRRIVEQLLYTGERVLKSVMYDASKRHGTTHEKCALPSETIFREHIINLGNGALRSAATFPCP